MAKSTPAKKTGTAVAKRGTGSGVSAFTGGVNPFVNYGNEAKSFGSFLKFSGNTGEYTYGPENESLEHGTQLVVNILEMQRGWVCWIGGKPFDSIMHRVIDDVQPLEEGDLPDYSAKYIDDEEDGWSRQVTVPMALLDDGSELEFKISSVSGIRAVQKLSKEFGTKCQLNVDENGNFKMPVIEISADEFELKKKKGVFKWAPTFKLVDWISVAEMNAMIAQSSEDEEEEEDEDAHLPPFDPETGEIDEDEIDDDVIDDGIEDDEDDDIEDEDEDEVEDDEDDDEAEAELARLQAKIAAAKAAKLKAAKAKAAAGVSAKSAKKSSLTDPGKRRTEKAY